MINSKLFIGGKWVDGGPPQEVFNKYTGTCIGTVVIARPADVEAALVAAKRSAPVMGQMSTYRRCKILRVAAKKLTERSEEIARLISEEAGKAIKLARVEVERAASTLCLAAEEVGRIHGETLPLDIVPSGEGYFGFWQRKPVGVVVAITPFNFPLNLVAHKIAPAIAAGNSSILKPAEQTPLTSVRFVEILQEAGVPDGGVNLVQGPGETVGDQLVTDSRVSKISFTGSQTVGEIITKRAGIKKVTLELGNSSPVIVAPDSDLDYVAKRCALGAYSYAGQVCISIQRIYGDRSIHEELTERIAQEANNMVMGNPLDENVDIGPLIETSAADRVEHWVNEASDNGARIVAGGIREGNLYQPTLLAAVTPEMKVMTKEIFGPVASVTACDSFEEALRAANSTEYGLQASVFTQDISRVLKAIGELDFGGVVVNDFPMFRTENMPYGGNRLSGLGREGLRFAVEEMTNIQMVVIRG